MNIPTRAASLAALLAAGAVLLPTAAFAKGGDDGGSDGRGGGQPAPAPEPAPAPDPAQSLCPEFANSGDTYLPDGSLLFANDFPGQMCLIATCSTTNVLTLAEVRVAAGWTTKTKASGGSSSNKIDVI